MITIVETERYLAMAQGSLDDEERAAIVDMIARSPSAGNLIQGSGGLRKVRVPMLGRGKSGGGRVITFFHDEGMPVFLLAFYAKNTRSDLSPAQKETARRATDAIRAQFGR